MPYVVTLTGFRPAPRADAVLWSHALIQESPDPVATVPVWTQIDDKVLTGYPDPTNPPIFNFTTDDATAALGLYYRVTFKDTNGVEGPPSSPVYNGGLSEAVPSAAEVRAEWPQAPWAEYGYPVPVPGAFDPLENLITESIVEFEGLSGVDPLAPATATDKRLPLIRKAIKLLTGYNAGGLQAEILDTVVDFDLLASMSAGTYSETRRALSANASIRHPWPALNKLLGLIIYFDSQGRPSRGGPAIGNRGLHPYPGHGILRHSDVLPRVHGDDCGYYGGSLPDGMLPALGARRAWTVSSSG